MSAVENHSRGCCRCSSAARADLSHLCLESRPCAFLLHCCVELPRFLCSSCTLGGVFSHVRLYFPSCSPAGIDHSVLMISRSEWCVAVNVLCLCVSSQCLDTSRALVDVKNASKDAEPRLLQGWFELTTPAHASHDVSRMRHFKLLACYFAENTLIKNVLLRRHM